MGDSGRRRPRGSGHRSTTIGPPASYRRSFRCRTALRPPREAALPPEPGQDRYDDFVALHRTLEDQLLLPVRRVWACGAALAMTLAGLAAGAAHASRILLDVQIPVFVDPAVPPGAAAAAYGVCAAAATIQATALLHVLSGSAARPARAFAWIGGIVVLLVALLPFTTRGPMPDVLGTVALNLAGGTLVVGVLTLAAVSVRPPPPWRSTRPPRRRRRRRRR